jgi:signal transduction histidine kinase
LNFSPSNDELLGLAPADLRVCGHGRYTAEDERQLLENFAGPDRIILAETYGRLLELFLAIKPVLLEQERVQNLLRQFAESENFSELFLQTQNLGKSALADASRPAVARAIHDLRGGALQALICRLELFKEGIEVDGMQSVFFLLRDHLKIMRNCIADLDPIRFVEDRAKKNHDAQLLVEKWTQTDFYGASTPVAVDFECRYAGHLCESCLEFSTLDRIIYNLMNNAAKYTADGVISFFVLPVPEPLPKSVRFVICNAVSVQQQATLQDRFSSNLSDIYRGGFTTGGHGLGLRIAADFCCSAYGLSDFQRGQDGHYFGASFLRDRFVAWFHWPIED